jgi:Tol biopolymer transport system component
MGKPSEKKGKQIVFQSLRDGTHEIYGMNADVTY